VVETVDTSGYCNEDSLALDSAGNPHVAYHNDNNGLKYGYWNGSSWISQTVDKGYGALVLDGTDRPHLFYAEFEGAVMHAYWSGSSWVKEIVEGGTARRYIRAARDSAGNPYACYTTSTGIEIAYWNGSSLTTEALPFWGDFKALTIDRWDRPHLCFRDGGYQLYYSYRTPEGWATPELVDPFGGDYSSIAVDADGVPHITHEGYVDGLCVRYTKRTSAGWVESKIEPGSYTALALDDTGSPVVTYAWDGLKYATIPEPSSLLALIGGLGSLGGMLLRRRK